MECRHLLSQHRNFEALSLRFKFTLVAKFQIGRPPLQEIKRYIISNWNLKGRVTISSVWDDKHIVIIMDSDEDVKAALTFPYRKIGHTYFRLFKWTADYNHKAEATKVTKWVRLPNLPMVLFDKACIKAIVSSFSEFLDIDDRTKDMSALSFARACVEIDVTHTIPSKVWIQIPGDKGFFQDIVIEGGMAYCTKCKIHGHDLTSCKKVHKPTTPILQVLQKEELVAQQPRTQKPKEQEWIKVQKKKKGEKAMQKTGQHGKSDNRSITETPSKESNPEITTIIVTREDTEINDNPTNQQVCQDMDSDPNAVMKTSENLENMEKAMNPTKETGNQKTHRFPNIIAAPAVKSLINRPYNIDQSADTSGNLRSITDDIKKQTTQTNMNENAEKTALSGEELKGDIVTTTVPNV